MDMETTILIIIMIIVNTTIMNTLMITIMIMTIQIIYMSMIIKNINMNISMLNNMTIKNNLKIKKKNLILLKEKLNHQQNIIITTIMVMHMEMEKKEDVRFQRCLNKLERNRNCRSREKFCQITFI
jgi:hypothetical protein